VASAAPKRIYRYTCAAGPDIGRGTGNPLNENLACTPPLPEDRDYTIVVEPTPPVFEFDVYGGPCDVALPGF